LAGTSTLNFDDGVLVVEQGMHQWRAATAATAGLVTIDWA
jgi:hypothetical protein